MKLSTIPLIGFLTLTCSVHADTIFSDDFQDTNINGWTSSGNGSALASVYNGNYSLRVNRTKSAITNISTQGFNNVSVALENCADLLRNFNVNIHAAFYDFKLGT